MSGPASAGLVRRVLRLFASDVPAAAPEPDPSAAGPFPIASSRVRRRVDLVGEIRSTGVVSYGTGAWFTAQLHDASGSVGLVWMGRTELPGVLPGRRLRARGRLAKNRGRRVVFNPDYALEPQPDSPAGL